MEDITATLTDINPTDRVYHVGNRYVKVRTVELPPPPGVRDFGFKVVQLSGSECDAQGKAIPRPVGWRVTDPETHTFQSHQSINFADVFRELHEGCVTRTIAAADLEDTFGSHFKETQNG